MRVSKEKKGGETALLLSLSLPLLVAPFSGCVLMVTRVAQRLTWSGLAESSLPLKKTLKSKLPFLGSANEAV